MCGHHPEIELGICSIRTKARIEQRRGGRVDERGLETAPVLNRLVREKRADQSLNSLTREGV